ncbi:UDP-4-amino-4,6-dideoxy-N-acetyl-beta-L-altrosamine transaminase, partial [Brevundimonas intermedia]
QWIDDADEAAVVAALRSPLLTQGERISEFESKLAARVGAEHCLVLANATAALHVAYAAMQLEGREGITSPNTFVATSNAMAYAGITPRFADIDARTLNLDPEAAARAINDATGVIAPVHFAGLPADMKRFQAVATEHGLRVVEDAAHAIGSQYPDGGQVGDCRYSDATVFSFHPVKTMTTGEGGAITTNDRALYDRMVLLRSHGLERAPEQMAKAPGPWFYEQQMLGYNYRMTELQAALGLSQLAKLDGFCIRRQQIVDAYHKGLAGLEWLTLPHVAEQSVCYHLFVLQVDFSSLGKSRSDVMAQLRHAGVGTQVHYIPVHLQPWYRDHFSTQIGDYPDAERYYERALSIPLFPAMTDGDVATVIDAVRKLSI